MLRLIGALLVTGAAASVGLRQILLCRQRISSLRSFASALELMNIELHFSLTPLPELLIKLSRDCAEPASSLLLGCGRELERAGGESFGVILSRALRRSGGLGLKSEELRVLTELGSVMGRCELESQSRAIERAAGKINRALGEAESELRENGKMYGALGLAAGLGLVIILI